MEIDEDINYTVSAPGKVILFGEHSAVYKKAAVATAIGLRLFVTVNAVKGKQISVKFPQINSKIVCNFEQFEKVVKEKCPLQNVALEFALDKPERIDYYKYIDSLQSNLESLGIIVSDLQEKTKMALIGFLFVMRGMCHTLKCNLVPFSLEVRSDLAVGAGTGSSAAFAVAIAGSVFHFRKCLEARNHITNTVLPIINDPVIVKSDSHDSGFSVHEKQIINLWAFYVERLMHVHPSGIDNTTCTFGSVVVKSQYQNRPTVSVFRTLENVPKISILLISSGIARNTSSLVAKVRQLRENHCAAVDAIFNAMDIIAHEAVTTLEALGSNSCIATKSTELYKILGQLMELNHGLLRTLGVSHENLERIVSVSNCSGLKSKLTGAGGGGYAYTLVPPNFSKIRLQALIEELGPEFKVTEINIAEEGIRLEKLVK